jgi:type IV pilus assembly protein PilE
MMMIGKISQAGNRLKTGTSGFTLIELLIALTILGILAAIIIPSYNAQVRRNNRTDAIAALLNIAQDLERCRSDSMAYNGAGCTDYTGGVLSDRQFYTITANPQNPTDFLLTAVPVAGGQQANDSQCAQFTLTQAGVRAAQDNSATPTDTTAECWR